MSSSEFITVDVSSSFLSASSASSSPLPFAPPPPPPPPPPPSQKEVDEPSEFTPSGKQPVVLLDDGEELYHYQRKHHGGKGDKLRSRFFVRLRDNVDGGEVWKCECGFILSKNRRVCEDESEKGKEGSRLRYKLEVFYKHLCMHHRPDIREITVDLVPKDRDSRMKLRAFFKMEGWQGDREVIAELKRDKKKGGSGKREREGVGLVKSSVSTSSSSSGAPPVPPASGSGGANSGAPPVPPASGSSGADSGAPPVPPASGAGAAADTGAPPPLPSTPATPSSSSLLQNSTGSSSSGLSSSALLHSAASFIPPPSASYWQEEGNGGGPSPSSPPFDFEEALNFLPYPSPSAPSGSKRGRKETLVSRLVDEYGVHFVPKAVGTQPLLKIKQDLFLLCADIQVTVSLSVSLSLSLSLSLSALSSLFFHFLGLLIFLV